MAKSWEFLPESGYTGGRLILFDFDTVIDRRQSDSIKWEKFRGRDILPLWVADMDFRSPPAVIEALHRRVDHGVFGYTAAPDSLDQAICDHLVARFGWRVSPEWLVWLPGLVPGLNVACRAIGGEGDAVLTTLPVYPPFLAAPGHFRRRLRTVPLRREGARWFFDFDRLQAAITPCTKLFLLCSPHNPVGRVFSRPELEQLAAICLRHDLIICSDEIHADLVLEQGQYHLPTASLSEEVAQRTITLLAPSKTYNIPGLGFSYAVIPNRSLRRDFLQAMAGIVPEVNLFGYTAALAAYQQGGGWLAALLDYLRENRDLVARAVARMPGLSGNRVEATYLAWLDARETGLPDPAAFFAAAGVGLSDGAEFGAPGFLRLNFACPRSLLQEALARMAAGLQQRAEEQ